MYVVTILESQEYRCESFVCPLVCRSKGREVGSQTKPSKVNLTCVPAYPCVCTHTYEQYIWGLQTTVPTVTRGALPSHTPWHWGHMCLCPFTSVGRNPWSAWSTSTWKLSAVHTVILYFRLRSSPTQVVPYQGHVSCSVIDLCMRSIWSNVPSVESFFGSREAGVISVMESSTLPANNFYLESLNCTRWHNGKYLGGVG